MENKINKCVDELKQDLLNKGVCQNKPIPLIILLDILRNHEESLRKFIEDRIDELKMSATGLLASFNVGKLTSMQLREHRRKITEFRGDKK